MVGSISRRRFRACMRHMLLPALSPLWYGVWGRSALLKFPSLIVDRLLFWGQSYIFLVQMVLYVLIIL